MRIAIIGGLASGPAAAAEAKRIDPEADVVLFEKGPHISVGSCEIPFFVADEIPDASSLEILTPQQFKESRGADVRVRHKVLAIQPEKGRLEVESLVHGSVHEEAFDRFVLASGARARRLGIDGEGAEGVFTVRNLEDAVAIKAWMEGEAVRHVVVVGGGFIGLEMADALQRRGLRVSVLDPGGSVLRGMLDERMSAPIVCAMHAVGVGLRAERVVGIDADSRGRVASVRTDRGEIIGCQAVILGIGIEPRTELAKAARIKIGVTGGISVDDQMRTSQRHVWACGDAIEVPRVVDGKKILWPLSPVARRTARIAARNAAGVKPADRFTGVTPSVAVQAFGIEAAAAGLSLKQAREANLDAEAFHVDHWSRVSSMPGARRLQVGLVVERTTGRLLGGSLVGEEGAALRANVLVPWIRSGITVKEIAEEMDLVYTPPIAPAMDPLRVAAAAAMRKLNR